MALAPGSDGSRPREGASCSQAHRIPTTTASTAVAASTVAASAFTPPPLVLAAIAAPVAKPARSARTPAALAAAAATLAFGTTRDLYFPCTAALSSARPASPTFPAACLVSPRDLG